MADEEKKEGGQEQKSLEDLKAKLGIVVKKPKEAEPQRPKEEDFKFTLNAPQGQAVQVEEPLEQVETLPKKKVPLAFIGALVGAGIVALILGLFFGKVMKERAIENMKIKEAQFLLKYFEEATGEKISASEGTILSVVKAHIEDTLNVFNALQKAQDQAALEAAQQKLEEYLKRCAKYAEKQPVFTFDGAFPGVIYDQQVASQVVQFIDGVRKLYQETGLLALEGETLRRIGELEEKGEMIETVVVEPIEEGGEKWLKGYFVAKIDTDNPRVEKGVKEYPVLPVGREKGFYAATTSLVKIDVSPIAKVKGQRYKQAIMARVRARFQAVKQAADLADFEPLRSKLQKSATRTPLFTIF
jgi:hypothetical protein